MKDGKDGGDRTRNAHARSCRPANRKCLVCDTTLRDGEQMPGVVFSPEEKVDLALQISDFGADYIELMPATSDLEADVAKRLVAVGLAGKLTASTMMRASHIDLAADLGFENVTLFAPVSDIQLVHKLAISRAENMERAQNMVEYARSRGLRVAFAGEDSTRADRRYLTDFINSLGRLSYFLACDTLGCLQPSDSLGFYGHLTNGCSTPIGLHVHNDFGLATANTLAGLEAGATLFSGTFTGIGERAGNAPIEEVCVALKYLYGTDLDLRYDRLYGICGLVQRYAATAVQKHKPLVGENAFAHESGVHVDGVMKNPRTYENFHPTEIGQARRILYGKHSGRAAVKMLLDKYGGGRPLEQALQDIKQASARLHMSFTEEEAMRVLNMSRAGLLGAGYGV